MLAGISLIFLMVCAAEAGCPWKECDPNHLPYPNMDQALHGYDISKADPFTSNVTAIGDPGWRSQIFLPTVYRDGHAQLDRIYARGALACSSCDVYTATTIKAYRQLQMSTINQGGSYDSPKLNSNLDISISLHRSDGYGIFANSTTIPAFHPEASSTVDSDEDIRNFFQRGGAMALTVCQCSVSVVGVSRYMYSQHHPGFTQGVQQLWSGLNTAEPMAALKEFTDKFGTHYSRRTVMGSRMVYQLRLPKGQLSSKGHEDIMKCFDAKRLEILDLPVAEAIKADCRFSPKTLGIPTERFSAFGPKPPKKVLHPEWATAALISPAPISMELEPVLDLLSDESLVDMFRNPSGVAVPTRAAFLEKLRPLWTNFGKITAQKSE